MIDPLDTMKYLLLHIQWNNYKRSVSLWLIHIKDPCNNVYVRVTYSSLFFI